MSIVIDSIGWTLLHFIWQGTLIGAATAAALALLHNVRAQHRYLVAGAGLIACVLWPALELLGRLRGPQANLADARFANSIMTLPLNGQAQGMTAFLQDQLSVIVGFWALCALLLALRMVAGLLWVRKAASSRGRNAALQCRVDQLAHRFGVNRAVDLRLVEDLDSPMTAGWLRPVILVPAALVSGMPPQLLQALLAHEMAHIKRFDYLVNLGQSVIESLLFYHPAVWWISRQVRAERELVADSMAAATLAEPRELAVALSELEKWSFSRHHLAQAANGGELATRVKLLLRPSNSPLNWKAALPVLALAMACLSALSHADPVADTVAKKSSRSKAPLADFNTCAKPVWPSESLKAEHTGTVTLSYLIGVDGKVKDSQVKNSSGHPLLDEAAREGIQQCRFKPGIRNGKPFESWMQMQYVWVLK